MPKGASVPRARMVAFWGEDGARAGGGMVMVGAAAVRAARAARVGMVDFIVGGGLGVKCYTVNERGSTKGVALIGGCL